MNSSTQFRRGLYYIHLFFRIPRKGWDEHPSPIAFGVDRPDARVGSSSSLGNPPFHRFKKKRGWWKVESSGNLSSENHLRWSSPSEKMPWNNTPGLKRWDEDVGFPVRLEGRAPRFRRISWNQWRSPRCRRFVTGFFGARDDELSNNEWYTKVVKHPGFPLLPCDVGGAIWS